MLLTPARDEVFLADAWAAIAAEDGFTAVIDILTRRGLASTPPFLLVEWTGERVAHILVRGQAGVMVERSGSGIETISAASVSTWVETTIDDVDGIEFEVAGAVGVGVARLPLVSGIGYAAAVRVEPRSERGSQPSRGSAVSTGADVVASPLPPSPASEPPASLGSATASISFAARLVAVPHIPPDAREVVESARAEPLLAAPARVGPVLIGRAAETAVLDAAAEDDLDDRVAVGDDPDDLPPEEAGFDDLRLADPRLPSSDLATLRRKRRAFPRTEPEREPVPGQLVLVLSPGGEREPLTAPILVGRSPSANRVSGNTLPRLVTMGTADQDISRTHAQFTLEAGTVLVTDLHSRNGTTVAMPGRPPQKLRAGEPTAIQVGSVVDFGGGLSIAIEEDSLVSVARTAP